MYWLLAAGKNYTLIRVKYLFLKIVLIIIQKNQPPLAKGGWFSHKNNVCRSLFYRDSFIAQLYDSCWDIIYLHQIFVQSKLHSAAIIENFWLSNTFGLLQKFFNPQYAGGASHPFQLQGFICHFRLLLKYHFFCINYDLQFLRDRLSGKGYKPYSFLEGAAPENNYKAEQPYQISIFDGPYSYKDQSYAKLLLRSSGADSPREILLREKPSSGEWFLWEQYLLSDIRAPQAEDPWAWNNWYSFSSI